MLVLRLWYEIALYYSQQQIDRTVNEYSPAFAQVAGGTGGCPVEADSVQALSTTIHR